MNKFSQEEWVQINRFYQWYQELKPQLTMPPELNIYSLTYLYAGTLDFVCKIEKGTYNVGSAKKQEIEEGIYIGDLKTGKGIDINYSRQLAAYAFAFEEMAGEKIQGAFVLHTQADTRQGWKMIILTQEELEIHFQTFLHAFEVWKNENQSLTPVIFDMPAKIQLFKDKEAL